METYNTKWNILEDRVIKANYDGEKLAIDMYDNGKFFSTILNNQDIENILSHRAHALPLEKRLIKDFDININTKRNTNTKRKKQRTGKNHRKNKNKTVRRKH